MNRFAALIAQLETLADAAMKTALVDDYLAQTPEPDRSLATDILARKLKPRPVKLALIRGLAAERIDPVLFALAEAYVGDVGETIALTWPPARRANRDPSLSEIVEALSTLGRSELPKRIEAWLDACDETGRWALIKLLTGTLRVDSATKDEAEPTDHQSELFRVPKKDTSGTLNAILLYAERTNARARLSPLRCTIGVWANDALLPVGQVDVALGAEADAIERYIAANTTARFGPVREVRRDRERALVLEVAFNAIARTPRRKSGLVLRTARLIRVNEDAAPSDATALDTLATRAPPG
ncbi:MAG: hypothetical protein KBA31_16420 [Alphaproteobacteria bacterium]|nr:hypothetical protein [Alphaproteobacteria bacterium]